MQVCWISRVVGVSDDVCGGIGVLFSTAVFDEVLSALGVDQLFAAGGLPRSGVFEAYG